MTFIFILLVVLTRQDETHNYEFETNLSNKLRICDSVVGLYIEQNKHSLDETLKTQNQTHQQRVIEHQYQIIVNHFYYMISNCYDHLYQNYRDTYIDDVLLFEIDWLPIINSDNYVTSHEQNQFNLTTKEELIRTFMSQERKRVFNYKIITKIYEQKGLSETNIINLISNFIGLELKSIVLISIVLIMSIFCFGLCCSMRWLVQDTIRSEAIQKQNVRPKYNFKID